MTIEQEIQQKKIEIETLSRMLDNAKKDLRALENIQKERNKHANL